MSAPLDGSWARALDHRLAECPYRFGSREASRWSRDFLVMDGVCRAEARRLRDRAEAWARRESCIGRAAPLSERGAILASTEFEIRRTE